MNSTSEIICNLLKHHFRHASREDIEDLAKRLQKGQPAADPIEGCLAAKKSEFVGGHKLLSAGSR